MQVSRTAFGYCWWCWHCPVWIFFQRVGSVDMSSPAPSFNSLPSSRKGRCVQSSLQCLSPLPQYAMFLFGGHLPSAPTPPHTHTYARTHAHTHTRTHTPTHLPNAAQLQKEQVCSEQHAVSPLHHTSASRIFVPIRHFVSVWLTFTTLTPHLHRTPHPQRCPSSEREGYVIVIKAASV